MKKIILLGSTGTIGKAVLDVVQNYPDKFKISALVVNKNIKKLSSQIKKFKPAAVGVFDTTIKMNLPAKIKIFKGEEGIKNLIKTIPADIVVNATSGVSGLIYTITAIDSGKDIALANKESIVMAGEIIKKKLKKKKVKLIPIDSEHNAIFNLLHGKDKKFINKIILTASGGPFFFKRKAEINRASIKEIFSHPVWKMGKKITFDSATMLNKGFEVIETHFLFDIPYEKIDIVVHPEGVIHSMVEFINGEIHALMGISNMRIPVMNALSYPETLNTFLPVLDLPKLKKIHFFKPNYKKFPLLGYAIEIGKKGGNLPSALCIADEIAQKLVIEGKLKFTKTFQFIKNIVENVKYIEKPELNDILKTVEEIRREFE